MIEERGEVHGKSFEHWLPDGGRKMFYDVLEVRFADGIQILMGAEEHTILLHWPRFVCCHVSDEAYREDCWIRDPKHAWSFFVSTDSALLRAYRTASCLLPETTHHYRLIGTNEVVDLLSQDTPTISFPKGDSDYEA